MMTGGALEANPPSKEMTRNAAFDYDILSLLRLKNKNLIDVPQVWVSPVAFK